MEIYLHGGRYKILAKVSEYFIVPSPTAAACLFLTFVASSYVGDAVSYKPSRLEVRVIHSELGQRSLISPFAWGANESLCDGVCSLVHPII